MYLTLLVAIVRTSVVLCNKHVVRMHVCASCTLLLTVYWSDAVHVNQVTPNYYKI